MSASKLSYESPAYMSYFSIEQSNYTDRIAWYESHFKEIQQIDDNARVEIDIDYCLSLFQVGRYNQYIAQSEPLIESVITNNIFEYNQKDIFQLLLFNKAASHYNVNQLEESNHILLELCKMDSSNKDYKTFAAKVIRIQSYRQFDTLKGIALGMILLSLIIIIFEILMVRTLLHEYITPVELSRNMLLICSFILLGYNEWQIKKHIKQTIGSR